MLRMKTPISVYSQPVSLFQTWKSRGIYHLWNWEPQLGTDENPSVTMLQYLDAAQAAGMKVALQFGTPSPIPYHHPAIYAFTLPDEYDNQVVNKMGTNNPPNLTDAQALAVEQLYEQAEAWCAVARTKRPDLPIMGSFSADQEQYAKAIYPRLIAPLDFYGWDYYFDLRDLTGQQWTQRNAAMIAIAPTKAAFSWVSSAKQNNPGGFYPNERTPTVQSVAYQLDCLEYARIQWSLFPDSFPPPNFQYDGTDQDIADLLTMRAYLAPPT